MQKRREKMKNIPFADLKPLHNEIELEVLEKFSNVYKNGWFINGEMVKEFEHEFANYCESNYCIGCGN